MINLYKNRANWIVVAISVITLLYKIEAGVIYYAINSGNW